MIGILPPLSQKRARQNPHVKGTMRQIEQGVVDHDPARRQQ